MTGQAASNSEPIVMTELEDRVVIAVLNLWQSDYSPLKYRKESTVTILVAVTAI